MFPVNFEKAKTARYLRCLAEGTPIESVHSIDDFAALAGACHFAMVSHGPVWKEAVAQALGKLRNPPNHPEHREAEDEEVFNDVQAAIEFYSHLSMLVQDGKLDTDYEPNVKALVWIAEDGTRSLRPISGHRDPKPPA